MATTRVYKFYSAKYGRIAIIKQRLKLTTFQSINDTFELYSTSTEDTEVRKAMKKWKQQFENKFGLISFCCNYTNPVVWGHYADNCSGICLGFDVDEKHLYNVEYSQHRIPPKKQDIKRSINLDCLDEVRDLITTKYTSWKYENEKRYFHKLNHPKVIQTNGIYFVPFGDIFLLKEIRLGPKYESTNKTCSEKIYKILEERNPYCKIITMRGAFKTFRIVKQTSETLCKRI